MEEDEWWEDDNLDIKRFPEGYDEKMERLETLVNQIKALVSEHMPQPPLQPNSNVMDMSSVMTLCNLVSTSINHIRVETPGYIQNSRERFTATQIQSHTQNIAKTLNYINETSVRVLGDWHGKWEQRIPPETLGRPLTKMAKICQEVSTALTKSENVIGTEAYLEPSAEVIDECRGAGPRK